MQVITCITTSVRASWMHDVRRPENPPTHETLLNSLALLPVLNGTQCRVETVSSFLVYLVPESQKRR